MGLRLYHLEDSPASRNTRMVLSALKLQFEFVEIDIMAGKNRTDEFLSLNPLGLIPCLKDGDYVIYESRAIAQYLCNSYEKDDETRLYPTDPKQRGIVDQMMYVSVQIHELIQKYVNFVGICFFDDVKPNDENISEVKKVLKLCEGYLSKSKYIAADNLTIADFFMLGPILQLELPRYTDFTEYPYTAEWLKIMKSLEYFDEVHKQGMHELDVLYQKKNPEN